MGLSLNLHRPCLAPGPCAGRSLQPLFAVRTKPRQFKTRRAFPLRFIQRPENPRLHQIFRPGSMPENVFATPMGPRKCLFGMGCKARHAAHSSAMGKWRNAADRPKRHLPFGLRRNRAICPPIPLHGLQPMLHGLGGQLIPIASQRGPIGIANTFSALSPGDCPGLTRSKILWITLVWLALNPYNPAALEQVFHNERRHA